MKKLIFLIILFFLLMALSAATAAPGDIGNNTPRAWRTR